MKYKDKLQQLVYSYPHICGYEVPTNLQNFTQKDLTEVKILQKVLRGGLFFETPCSLLKTKFNTQGVYHFWKCWKSTGI